MRKMILAVVVTLTAAVWVEGHHSIAGVYDSSRSVTIAATVTRFRFVNPHPFIEATVPAPGGVQQPWHLELDNRGELAAIGITDETLRPGDQIEVTGSLSRSQRNALYVRKLRRPSDGFQYEQVGASPRITR